MSKFLGTKLYKDQYVLLTGCKVKGDNALYKVTRDVANDENYMGDNGYVLEKVKLNGELKTSGYTIYFYDNNGLKRDPNVTAEGLNGIEDLKEANKKLKYYLKERDNKEIVNKITETSERIDLNEVGKIYKVKMVNSVSFSTNGWYNNKSFRKGNYYKVTVRKDNKINVVLLNKKGDDYSFDTACKYNHNLNEKLTKLFIKNSIIINIEKVTKESLNKEQETKETESAETKQENNNNSEKTNNEVIEKKSQYIITEDVHTKTNEKIYVVKFEKKFDKDEYVQVAKKIKFIGGYYSKFKKGFIFKENPIEKMKETFGNNKADEQLENIEEPIINKQDDFKESEQKDNKINNEKEAEGMNNINLENLFNNIEIKNENRLSDEDNLVVEKFKNTLADMRDKFNIYIDMYEKNPIQKINVNSNLEIKEEEINGVEDSIRSFKAEFIENVVNRQTKNLINDLYYYFSKKYNIELKNNSHNTSYYEGRLDEAEENFKYFMTISIDDIVDNIFNQLGGNSLQEKAIQEAKEKLKKACASYRNEKVVTVKSNTISINDFMYYDSFALQWNDGYRLSSGGISKVENLLKLLNYNNTGIFEVAEDYKTFLDTISDYKNKFIGQYEINNSYIDSIKTFKNGKLNIKFNSSVQALDFAKKYLGYQ